MQKIDLSSGQWASMRALIFTQSHTIWCSGVELHGANTPVHSELCWPWGTQTLPLNQTLRSSCCGVSAARLWWSSGPACPGQWRAGSAPVCNRSFHGAKAHRATGLCFYVKFNSTILSVASTVKQKKREIKSVPQVGSHWIQPAVLVKQAAWHCLCHNASSPPRYPSSAAGSTDVWS